MADLRHKGMCYSVWDAFTGLILRRSKLLDPILTCNSASWTVVPKFQPLLVFETHFWIVQIGLWASEFYMEVLIQFIQKILDCGTVKN